MRAEDVLAEFGPSNEQRRLDEIRTRYIEPAARAWVERQYAAYVASIESALVKDVLGWQQQANGAGE